MKIKINFLKNAFLAAMMLVLVVACQPQSQNVVEIPTQMVLPSLTPSNTSTATTTATITASATSTYTQTSTPTPTHTPTPTPSTTPSATPTATITSSATITNTPTVTPTFTPTATFTPSITPTPNAPQIISFTASATTVTPGTQITLTWVTVSDGTRIDQLNSQGQVVQSFPPNLPSGQMSVVVPSAAGNLVIYRLTAQRNNQEISVSIPITVTCAVNWFFGNQFVPANAGCPTAAGATGPGAFQPFERGVMFYINANNLDRIYGLQNNQNLYVGFSNDWDGTPMSYDAPPSGLFPPRRMFRWVFKFNPVNPPIAVSGGWQEALGWATAEFNDGNRTIQYESGGAFYLDAPGGAVYRLSGGDSGTWTKIK